MYFLYFFIFFLNSFFEGVFCKSRFRYLFFFIGVLLFFYIQCFNQWSPDIESYINHFENVDEDFIISTQEPFHIFLIRICRFLGFDFQNFIFIYGFLIISLFMYFIYKSTPLPSLVLFFFFLIPFYPNIVQLRNFLAFAVFFVALKFWDNKKILSLLYVFCVLTHYSFLVLLPFFIIRKFEFFKRTKINNLIILFGVVLVMLLPKEYGDMFILGVNDKYSVYSENSKGFLGTVLLFLPFFMINSFVIWHYNKNGVSQNVLIPLVYNKQIPLIVELIQYSNYLIIAQYFIRDFSRFNMNILVLNFIYLTIVFYYVILPKKGAFQVIEYNVLLFLYVVFIFIITFFLLNNGSYFEIIEKTITSNINF